MIYIYIYILAYFHLLYSMIVCIFGFGLLFTLHLQFTFSLVSCNPSSCFRSVSAGSYMVLEVFGGSGESSTDDDVQGSSGEPVAGGDSGIDLKKLLSSSSQSSGGPNLNRQIMTHLRLLQANLQHLKVTSFSLKMVRDRQIYNDPKILECTVSHRSEYTPHIFVNILLYLFIRAATNDYFYFD